MEQSNNTSITSSESNQVALSIITPVLNGERFIRSCLENVIDQLGDQVTTGSVEHILIDGGSIDRTLEIIEHYRVQHAHVRWASEPGAGQSVAMNKGIFLAKGKIIGFLNVDDFYEPGVIRQVLGISEKVRSPAFIVGVCHVLNENGQVVFINRPVKISHLRLLMGQSIQPYPINPSSYFYHKSIHKIVGGYDPAEHYALDLEMILRMAPLVNFYFTDEHWGNYRLYPETKTYQDMQAGMTYKRIDELMSKYQKKLPLVQRTWVRLNYKLAKGWYLESIRFFLRNPNELLRRFSHRIRHFLKIHGLGKNDKNIETDS